MSYYDEQLLRLQQQAARKRQLEAMLCDLRNQADERRSRAEALKSAMQKEQSDVDRLEGRSLAAFFYAVIGKMDEKLDQERSEAYAAHVKYDAAALELASLEEEIRSKDAELTELEGCRERYIHLLREKAEAIKQAGGEAGMEILHLEHLLGDLGQREREIGEAVSAGEAALSAADEVLSHLKKAEDWADLDLFLNGGLFAEISKHDELDSAQAAVERLQLRLQGFRTELADVTAIGADLRVGIDGFHRFADYFFDGLFVDWSILQEISQSRERVQETRKQIQDTLEQLGKIRAGVEQETKSTGEWMEELVRRTGV